MADTPQVQVALDTRLLVENPIQVVVEGASQNLPRKIAATSVSASQIQFQNILSIGSNVLIDPNVFINYQVAVVFDKTANINSPITAQPQYIRPPGITNNAGAVSQTSVYGNATSQNSVPNVCFRKFPLTSCTNSIDLSFNNVQTTVQASQLLNLVREWSVNAQDSRQLSSSCPTYNYRQPAVLEQPVDAIVPNQPNTPYSYAGGWSNATFSPISVNVPETGNIITVIYEISEPVFVSPFCLQKSAGLGQIQSINLRYNLDNSVNLQNMLLSPYGWTTAQLQASIISASLYLDYLTIDPLSTGPLPPICYYNYEFPDLNNTPYNSVPAVLTSRTAGFSQTTQSFKLSTMPKYYCLKVSPSYSSASCTNTIAGCPITTIQITFGSLGQFLFDREQLWQCFRRNSGNNDLTYQEWVAMGTPVLLQPAVDITSAGQLFQGKSGNSDIMFQNVVNFTMENYYDSFGTTNLNTALGLPANTQFPLQVYEAFINSGNVAIGAGSCVWKNTTATEAEFVQALDKEKVSEEAVKTAAGLSAGSFMSSMRGLMHGAKQIAGTTAKVLQHPMTQKGLEALAGSGLVHGRRGRRM